MPDLDFSILGVEHAAHGLTPLLHFKLAVMNTPADETIQSVILQAQIQILAPGRSYNENEKPKLIDLFGTPDQWGTTLRARLWTLSSTTVRTFTGSTEAVLPVPCSFDLNVAGTKYFYALEGGEVPLLFLFSGTIFYAAPNGQLQVDRSFRSNRVSIFAQSGAYRNQGHTSPVGSMGGSNFRRWPRSQ